MAMDRINFALEFMSMGESRAHFLTYDGYLGAIGAFMKEFEVAHDSHHAQLHHSKTVI
jgi:pantothenate kinase